MQSSLNVSEESGSVTESKEYREEKIVRESSAVGDDVCSQETIKIVASRQPSQPQQVVSKHQIKHSRQSLGLLTSKQESRTSDKSQTRPAKPAIPIAESPSDQEAHFSLSKSSSVSANLCGPQSHLAI